MSVGQQINKRRPVTITRAQGNEKGQSDFCIDHLHMASLPNDLVGYNSARPVHVFMLS